MGDQVESYYLRGLAAFEIPQGASIFEQAVARLRNAIMTGGLRPGQKLVEGDLCEMLGISRPSLREVLRALEAEKLIELIPNRGPSVARLDYNQVEEIHDVWALLTGAAVHNFTAKARREDVADLGEAMVAIERAVVQRSPLDQLAATNHFFNIINTRCGNAILSEFVVLIVSRVNFLRAQALLYEGWGRLYAQEIGQILAAIDSGAAGAARLAVQKHIASACSAAQQVVLSPSLAEATRSRGRGVRRAAAS